MALIPLRAPATSWIAAPYRSSPTNCSVVIGSTCSFVSTRSFSFVLLASDGDLLPESAHYSFTPGRIYNLQADDVIQAHPDIVKPETAWALLSAAGLARL